jgi:hypothetical protein
MKRARLGPFDVWIPQTRRERRRGLLGCADLAGHEGLLLQRCRSIHTFGMRIGIDAVLLDRRYRVLGVVPMAPGRVLFPRPGVRHVLEVASGSAPRVGLALRLSEEPERVAVSPAGPGPPGG